MSGVCIISVLLGHGMSSPPTGCTQLLLKPLPCQPNSRWSLPPEPEAGLRGGVVLWTCVQVFGPLTDYMTVCTITHSLHVLDGFNTTSESLVPLISQS